MQTTTLPIPPGWFGVILFAVAVALVAAYLLGSARKMPGPLDRFRKRLGYANMDGGLFLLLALFMIAAGILWACVTGYLLYGLLGLVNSLLSSPPPPMSPVTDADKQILWNWRFELAQLAALTTLLTVVIALPITLNRLRLSRQQTRMADESLFNQKITEAAADLHAQRQVTRTTEKDGQTELFNAWEDDVVRRNAAIDRLEGLLRERSAVTPDLATAERIARLLSVYLREMSREQRAEEHGWMQVRALTNPQDDSPPLTETEALTQLGPHPDNASLEALKRWARGLQIRSDMEKAAQTLGRMTHTCRLDKNTLPIDLRGTNLQGAALTPGDFRNADLFEAEMQGANLSRAKLQGADLFKAEMQGAVLSGAEMQEADLFEAEIQGADLRGAKMQGADLGWAKMQGADLFEAEMQEADLSWAEMQGAKLRGAELQGAVLSGAKMQGAVLSGAKMDDLTDLNAAALRGAALSSVDDTTIAKLRPFWQDIFADGTVRLPDGEPRPAHWADKKLGLREFETAWHEWQRSIGMDPDNPQ